MPFRKLILACLFASASVYGASDPFVGTWIYNQEKSPKPTIHYKIKDLGEDRYALTGSGGDTTNIKADGVFIKGPDADKVSFQKLDDHNWQMIRFQPDKMVRTYTMSTDDKTLVIKDVFTLPGGKAGKIVFTYARFSPGKSLFGEWQSVSETKDFPSDVITETIISPFGKDGLTIASSTNKNRLDLNFDGKAYFETGPTAKKGDGTSAKRVNGHLLTMQDSTNGIPEDKQEWRVSDDGKTLTIISRPIKSSAVFTTVLDRR